MAIGAGCPNDSFQKILLSYPSPEVVANKECSDRLLWLDRSSTSEPSVVEAAERARSVGAEALGTGAAEELAARWTAGPVFWQVKQVHIELHGTPP